MAPMSDGGPARYDGIADWYDAQLATAPHRGRILREHLVPGTGLCLDVGCGTGRALDVIAEFGWTPIGIELSSDQLRLARDRGSHLIQGDAEHLPFRAHSFQQVVSSWTSTDVDHFDRMLAEIARVLVPGGHFLFYGVHPCFNGPHVQSRPDGSWIVHPSYREARRHLWSPWWGENGIRTTVGGMRHVPLADFLNAFSAAGLHLMHVAEPGDQPIPVAIVVRAAKPG